jgi:exopolyphosphatase/guanosine-5'-triphosphate,3'-diphosphate pyrophosphatase
VARAGPVPVRSPDPRRRYAPRPGPAYAALDLGTNNCRLLVAEPAHFGFRVVDAFSRIVRLGEGLGHGDRLSEGAIERTIDALRVCRAKMDARRVTRARLVATEACRSAANGAAFIDRVRDEIGLDLEVLDRRTEAYLAVTGCAALADPRAQSVVVFDIGGGSTEIAWLDGIAPVISSDPSKRIRAWDFPSCRGGDAGRAARRRRGHAHGVRGHGGGGVRPSPRFRGRRLTRRERAGLPPSRHLGDRDHRRRHPSRPRPLRPPARRRDVDADVEVDAVLERLIRTGFDQRASNPCIGRDRADLVLAGCAILEAIRRAFPSERLRIADRGLREGILMTLMREDDVWRRGGRG